MKKFAILFLVQLFCLSLPFSGGAAAPVCRKSVSDSAQSLRVLLSDVQIKETAIELLNRAEFKIEIEVAALNDPDVHALLLKRLDEKLQVVVIIPDMAPMGKSPFTLGNHAKIVPEIIAKGGTIVFADGKVLQRESQMPNPTMHRKLLVVDENQAILSTSNLSFGYGNIDVAVHVQGPLVRSIREIFQRDFDQFVRGEYWPVDVIGDGTLKVTDGSRVSHFEFFKEALKKAKSEILLSAFEISDPQVIRLIIETAKLRPELKISVLTGPIVRTRHLIRLEISIPSNATLHTQLQKAGIIVKQFEKGTAFNHARIMVIDGKEVWVSSADLSRRGLYGNPEISFLVTESHLVQEFKTHFLNIWSHGKEKEVKTSHVMTEKLIRFFEDAFLKVSKLQFVSTKISQMVKSQIYRMLAVERIRGFFFDVDDVNASTHHAWSKLYVGVSHFDSARDYSKQLYRKVGRYGEGIYMTSSEFIASSYGIFSSQRRTLKTATLLEFEPAKELRLFDYDINKEQFKSWVKQGLANGSLSKFEFHRHLRLFCEEMGFDGAFFEAQDAKDSVNLLIYKTENLRYLGRRDIQL